LDSNLRAGEPSAKSGRSEIVQSAYISDVQSDRKWTCGFRSEPFDKISVYFQDRLGESLERKGIRRAPVLDGSSCFVVLELLKVTARPEFLKKPGMDVSATVTILDSNHHTVYAKGFHGESRMLMNTYGHLINRVIGDMVESIVEDENVIKAVAQCKLEAKLTARRADRAARRNP
jgi:hypothetical protein